MVVRPDMVNGHDLCHGGLIASLADSAFALACNSHGPVTVAAGFEVDFLEPGRLGQTLDADAREVSLRGRTGVYDVTVRADDTGGGRVPRPQPFAGSAHLTGPRREGTSRARRSALPWDGSVRAGRSVMKVRWLLSSLVALVLAAPLVLALGPASSGAERRVVRTHDAGARRRAGGPPRRRRPGRLRVQGRPARDSVQVGYVDRLFADGSGRRVRVAGQALLRVRFERAQAHTDDGSSTAAPRRVAYALPNVMTAVRAGDFEARHDVRPRAGEADAGPRHDAAGAAAGGRRGRRRVRHRAAQGVVPRPGPVRREPGAVLRRGPSPGGPRRPRHGADGPPLRRPAGGGAVARPAPAALRRHRVRRPHGRGRHGRPAAHGPLPQRRCHGEHRGRGAADPQAAARPSTASSCATRPGARSTPTGRATRPPPASSPEPSGRRRGAHQAVEGQAW